MNKRSSLSILKCFACLLTTLLLAIPLQAQSGAAPEVDEVEKLAVLVQEVADEVGQMAETNQAARMRLRSDERGLSAENISAGQLENALGGGGLAGVDVGEDADVSVGAEVSHVASLE